MKPKGLKANFFTFYNAIAGVVTELFTTVILMAAAFILGTVILKWFHR
jgi:hypothetical protein